MEEKNGARKKSSRSGRDVVYEIEGRFFVWDKIKAE